jgi:UDP-glucuronate 4-epimerase
LNIEYRALSSLKILITGAAGFIGFHLSKRLLDDGYDVVGIDNLNQYYDVDLKQARISQLFATPPVFEKRGANTNQIAK